MTDADKVEFARLMETLAVLRKEPLTATVLRVYFSVLVDLNIADVERGVVACLKLDEFFPSPARLRQFAIAIDGTATSRAATCFEALLGAGPRYSPRSGDYWLVQDVEARFGLVAREAFIAVGGTLAFQHRTDKSLPFLRRDFLAAWEEVEPRALAGELQPTLPATKSPVRALVTDTAAKLDLARSQNLKQLPRGDR